MKKVIIILLVLSLAANVFMAVVAGRMYSELQQKEQADAKQIYLAIKGIPDINRILQNMIKTKSVQRHELSYIQQQLMYTLAGCDKASRLYHDELRITDNDRKLYVYLVALEDILYKVESINPLDHDIIKALTNAENVAGGQYRYSLAEYMQLQAEKTEKALESINVSEQSSYDVDGVVSDFPSPEEVKDAFVNAVK